MPGGHKDPFDLLSAVNFFCQIRTRLFPFFDHSCHPSVSLCQNLLVCSNDRASDCMWCKSTPKHETADHVDQLMSYSLFKKRHGDKINSQDRKLVVEASMEFLTSEIGSVHYRLRWPFGDSEM